MLPTVSAIQAPPLAVLPALPQSWSALTWHQLTACWQCKLRYGSNADVASVAAMLALCGLDVAGRDGYSDTTGEAVYTLRSDDGSLRTVTARELSQLARQTMKWFAYPYGDPGKEAVRDEKGKIVEEAVAPVPGYVNPDWRDAMMLPGETVTVGGVCFALPQVACNNLTWQQYRSLQATAPGLFEDGASEEVIIGRQAQFVAQILVPASEEQQSGDRFAPTHVFQYDADRAEQSVAFWREQLPMMPELFHILFQTYQTAMRYYEKVFPLLFNGGGKSDKLQDALTGETRTLNAVMKYQGYTKPEDVYAENLPVILSTLNTMAEEAKQIEQMNAKIKSKKH